MKYVVVNMGELEKKEIDRLRPSLAMKARMGETVLAKSIGKGTGLHTVKIDGHSVAVPEEVVQNKFDNCPECGSKVLWHDTEQAQFCPFCYDS